MKHTYTITGMTCNNCKATVEERLNALDLVISSNANPDKNEVTVEMKSHIPLQTLQEALPEK